MDFIVNNYMIFIIIAIVLILGILGYIIDKKKYNDYRKEILNENNQNILQTNQPQVEIPELNNANEIPSINNQDSNNQ